MVGRSVYAVLFSCYKEPLIRFDVAPIGIFLKHLWRVVAGINGVRDHREILVGFELTMDLFQILGHDGADARAAGKEEIDHMDLSFHLLLREWIAILIREMIGRNGTIVLNAILIGGGEVG